MPAAQRRAAGEDAIVAASVRQLVTLFGQEAAAPRATLFTDRAADDLTATAADWTDGGHPAAHDRAWVEGAWSKCITLATSETSAIEPGYLAGAAVHASARAVAELKRRIARP